MRVLFITQEVPNKEHNTDTINANLLIEALMDEGHDVSILLVMPEMSLITDSSTRKRWLDQLKTLGLPIHIVYEKPIPIPSTFRRNGTFLGNLRANIRRMVFPRLEYYFPQALLVSETTPILKKTSPDVIFIWGSYSNIAALGQRHGIPIFAFVGDPVHMPLMYRTRPPISPRLSPLEPDYWKLKIETRHRVRYMLKLLKQCRSAGASAAHHARWYREKGVKECVYLPNMIPDWGGPDWEEKRGPIENKGKFKVLLMGHVLSTTNLSGLHSLADEILPVLDKELGDELEFHICGKGEIPEDLRKKLDYPFVLIRGFVEDIISELRDSDVVLISTPIPMGVRVRTAYMWSVGCCVVAHEANARGLPEMVHEKNALLGRNGREVAREIIRAHNDPELRRRLIRSGRKTFETCFSPEVTRTKIFSRLETAAGRKPIRNEPYHGTGME